MFGRMQSVFPFTIQLMFNQILKKLIVCLVNSHKTTAYKTYPNEPACYSGYDVGFSQNEFEMRLAEKSN